jgi:hypothetical protein
VSGSNHDHVVGLINVIKEKLNPYLYGFGGTEHRIFLMAVFYVLLFSIFIYITWKVDVNKIYFFSLLIMAILPNAVVYGFRWDVIFPGTLITHDNLTFLQRYSHIFTFLSFLIAIIPLGFIKRIAGNQALKRDAAKDRRAP